jgi:arylsulfatase A-like enzyme
MPYTTKLLRLCAILSKGESWRQGLRSGYARMMETFAGYGAHVDHEMGRVLDAVAKLPDADNTLIIYIIGDNGSPATSRRSGPRSQPWGFVGVRLNHLKRRIGGNILLYIKT